MKTLIILAHPRDTSLTYKIKESFEKGLKDAGHEVDTLDLYKIKFNPVLYEEDEPKWMEETQTYSDEVHREIERLKEYDAIIFSFPIYWSGMPAMLKGYIDRVWNYSLAYGPGSDDFKPKKVLFMPVAGASPKQWVKHKYVDSVTISLNNITSYCGIENTKIKPYLETIGTNPNAKDHIVVAYEEGLNFEKW